MAAFSLATIWLLYVLAEKLAIAGLTHIAIRHVENAQPVRWFNQPIYPANLHLELTRQFVSRCLLATALVTFSATCTVVLARWWHSGWIKLACTGIVITCASIVAMLVRWAWMVGYPALMPFFAEQTEAGSRLQWIAGVLLFLAASFGFIYRLVPDRRPGVTGVIIPPKNDALHLSTGVMALFMVAAIAWGSPIVVVEGVLHMGDR